MNFRDKIVELVASAEEDPQLRSHVEAEAESYLEQFRGWPCATQVPLARVAYIVAGLLLEPDANVRRLRATDGVKIGDGIG